MQKHCHIRQRALRGGAPRAPPQTQHSKHTAQKQVQTKNKNAESVGGAPEGVWNGHLEMQSSKHVKISWNGRVWEQAHEVPPKHLLETTRSWSLWLPWPQPLCSLGTYFKSECLTLQLWSLQELSVLCPPRHRGMLTVEGRRTCEKSA